jgi:predicted GIY-YIG superfamily endonuclease
MFETLKVLSKSITYNGRQILLATALMVIIVYIYSLYAYYFVLDTFWNDAFDGGENQCTSVRHCFFTIFSLGPRSSGSVGDVLTRQSYLPGNKTKYYSRYIFDLSIFVVVNVMGMNIIFGIIIQTFAQLRDMMNVKTNDMLNICFVCSLDRNEIDKTIEGFDYHIAHDHHVWNYLYFMYYLRRKDPTLYCGLETSVANRIYKDDLSWFPFGKCMKLSTIESEETTEQLVEDACKRLEAITKMYKQAAKNQRSSTQNATGVESPRKSVA